MADQSVILSLDEVPGFIPCTVLDAAGTTGRLAVDGELQPNAVGRLVLGAPGYLVFEQFGTPIGLRVAVRARPRHLDVAILDSAPSTNRRSRARLKLVTPVRIASVDGNEPVPEALTQTIDISERGASLGRHPALDGCRRMGLELSFGSDPEPVAVEARFVRLTPETVGVEFETFRADGAKRLREFLAGVEHRQASPRLGELTS